MRGSREDSKKKEEEERGSERQGSFPGPVGEAVAHYIFFGVTIFSFKSCWVIDFRDDYYAVGFWRKDVYSPCAVRFQRKALSCECFQSKKK